MRFTLKNPLSLQYIDYQNVRKTEFLGCQSQEVVGFSPLDSGQFRPDTPYTFPPSGMYWKEGFFVPQRHSPCTNGSNYTDWYTGRLSHVPIISFRAIGTQKEAFLYHFGAGRGRRDFHVTPQPASLTAPSGSGPRVQVGEFTKKATRIPDGLWSGKRDLSPLTRAARLSRYPSVGFADSSLGERVASSSRGIYQKGHPDSGWPLERKTRLEPAHAGGATFTLPLSRLRRQLPRGAGREFKSGIIPKRPPGIRMAFGAENET